MKSAHSNKNLLLKLIIGFIGIICFFTGCSIINKYFKADKPFALVKISSDQYPSFFDDMAYNSITYSILQSIAYLKKLSYQKQFIFGNDIFTTTHMIESLSFFLDFIHTKPSNKQLNTFIKSKYAVYKSVGNKKSGLVLFTGYFEPILKGSLEKNSEYKYPVYKSPDNLITIDLSSFSSKFKGKKITGRLTGQSFVPYYNRKEIETDDVLKGQGTAIAWVKDRIDLFFLHIQGSGKIYVDNGKFINVHYHKVNGHPYKSIGSLLIKEKKIDRSEMSMQKIRSYLNEHPKEIDAILNYNPSYVFFKIENDGPLGYLEVKLTPGRSLAIDRRIFPLAALSYIETKKPVVDGNANIVYWKNFSRFVLNHDTGGAIKGPGRADLFWGNGQYAEIAAGYMQHHGNLYFLIKKP